MTCFQINNTPVENLSLPEAKKLIEKSKEKLQLIVSKKERDPPQAPAQQPVQESGISMYNHMLNIFN